MTRCRHLDHSEDIYFKVTGEPALGLVEAFETEHRARLKTLIRYLRSIRASTTRFWSWSTHLAGVRFRREPPVGWRVGKDMEDCCVPDRRTAEGRVLLKEFSAVRVKGDLEQLSKDLGFTTFISAPEGLFMTYIGVQKLKNGSFVINCHPLMAQPETRTGRRSRKSVSLLGLTPLKASQYHALIEAEEKPRRKSA